MPFTQEDFNQENATRLNVIIMKQMDKPPLTRYYSLGQALKDKHKRLLNEYIASLPEDWEPKLVGDFNTIVNEDILNEDFDPSKQFVKEINTDPQMLLSPEQEAWIKEETDAGRPPVF
jgi:hypothetical protein